MAEVKEMKALANAFCINSCSAAKMHECDCFGTSCEQLLYFLVDMHNQNNKLEVL